LAGVFWNDTSRHIMFFRTETPVAIIIRSLAGPVPAG
jgi:hypothetical protein